MVQTISHRFNTHVKRLSLSASGVIIIITRLLATSRIITQYSIIYCYTILPPVHLNLLSHASLQLVESSHNIQSFTVIQFYHQST